MIEALVCAATRLILLAVAGTKPRRVIAVQVGVDMLPVAPVDMTGNVAVLVEATVV